MDQCAAMKYSGNTSESAKVSCLKRLEMRAHIVEQEQVIHEFPSNRHVFGLVIVDVFATLQTSSCSKYM